MTSGSSIGVLALRAEAASAVAASATTLPCSIGSGASGGPSFTRLRNGRGGRESALITGLAALPCCRMLLAAGDDGAVRICR